MPIQGGRIFVFSWMIVILPCQVRQNLSGGVRLAMATKWDIDEAVRSNAHIDTRATMVINNLSFRYSCNLRPVYTGCMGVGCVMPSRRSKVTSVSFLSMIAFPDDLII
jgi:hypothetical protein